MQRDFEGGAMASWQKRGDILRAAGSRGVVRLQGNTVDNLMPGEHLGAIFMGT